MLWNKFCLVVIFCARLVSSYNNEHSGDLVARFSGCDMMFSRYYRAAKELRITILLSTCDIGLLS